MAQVDAFHTDTVLRTYHPRERYVYHNQSKCEYGERIIKDGNKLDGKGRDPQGNPRELCDKCQALA
jgi:hypothetical protein